MKRDNYFATKRGPKPEPLCPELQMFSDAQDFLRREFDRLPLEPCAHCRERRAKELKMRAHQLVLDVTRWMEREARA